MKRLRTTAIHRSYTGRFDNLHWKNIRLWISEVKECCTEITATSLSFATPQWNYLSSRFRFWPSTWGRQAENARISALSRLPTHRKSLVGLRLFRYAEMAASAFRNNALFSYDACKGMHCYSRDLEAALQWPGFKKLAQLKHQKHSRGLETTESCQQRQLFWHKFAKWKHLRKQVTNTVFFQDFSCQQDAFITRWSRFQSVVRLANIAAKKLKISSLTKKWSCYRGFRQWRWIVFHSERKALGFNGHMLRNTRYRT